ncbi:hypothetical protein [Desulfovibrio inopinatus]|uniref:hypothetical protein n=1 Tax=Desulfovibrio inopinatus TaxID=102109 RepID=UPI0012EB3B92|nr:hypothetical protein [Desulfovibrio inopinatus]
MKRAKMLCFLTADVLRKRHARTTGGLVVNNTFAAYTHIHALGAPHWAPAFVKAALRYRNTVSNR